jgi:uncharacterized membrane protein
MQTLASVRKHPVHPMLFVLPLGFWVFSLFCDLLYLIGAEAAIWSSLAFYSMVGGFVGGLTAVVLAGFVDVSLLAERQVKRTGLTHLNLTLIVVALYAVNIWLRFSDPASLAIAIVLSAFGLSMLAVASWLGDEPVGLRNEK